MRGNKERGTKNGQYSGARTHREVNLSKKKEEKNVKRSNIMNTSLCPQLHNVHMVFSDNPRLPHFGKNRPVSFLIFPTFTHIYSSYYILEYGL